MIDLEQSVHEQRHCQGVSNMVKTQVDLDRYATIIASVRPAWILETGSFNGASACHFANVAQCDVVSIDTNPQITDPAIRHHPLVTWITGNSADPNIVAYVRSLVGDASPVMVVLDSDHRAAHVLAEMDAYGPMVTPGSYMVVEDGIVRYVPEQLAVYDNSSPLDAIELFLGTHPEFVVDSDIEAMHPTTQHPSGFLRRLVA